MSDGTQHMHVRTAPNDGGCGVKQSADRDNRNAFTACNKCVGDYLVNQIHLHLCNTRD